MRVKYRSARSDIEDVIRYPLDLKKMIDTFMVVM